MSSNADTPNQTGGSSTVALVFILGSVVLGSLFYVSVRYTSPILRQWLARVNGDITDQAPILGLSPSDIEAFPTFIYRGAIEHRGNGTDVSGNHNGHKSSDGKYNENRKVNGKGHGISVDCSICLCDLEENDVVRMLPVCRHFFHIQCVDVWLYSHPSCPICRARMQVESAALTECSMSPPLPQFSRYCNLPGSDQGNTPAAIEEVAVVPQNGEITEIVEGQESEMVTTLDHVSKRSLCSDSSEVRVDIKDEVNFESCPGEYFGKSVSSKEALCACQNGSPSQKVPVDEAMSEPENQEIPETTSIKGSPEIQVELEEDDVPVQLEENV